MISTSNTENAALVEEVWGVNLMRYLSAVGMVLVHYDFLLTLDDEMRLVWPGTLHWPKALYYINRYASVLVMIYSNYQIANFRPPLSVHFCQTWTWVTTVAYIVRFIAATALLCLRVVALYHGVRWMKWLLWIGFVFCYGIRLGITTAGGYYYAESVIYSPISGQCLTGGMKWTGTPLPGIMSVALTMLFEILLLSLIIAKVRKSTTSIDSLSSSPLMRVVVRDEILWFVAIVMARISLLVSWFTLPPTLVTVAYNAEWGLESALISRFFLNLRSIYNRGQSTLGSKSVSSTLSPFRTLPYWRRVTRVETDFPDGLEAETGIYGNFPNRNEGNVPEAATVDLEPSVELVLRTQHGGDGHHMGPIVDLAPPENKLTL